jgi:hypothetical protein
MSAHFPTVYNIKNSHLPQIFMTPQQFEEKSPQLEARVATLETELAQMKKTMSGFLQTKTPWWLKVAGSFENDPTFDEVVRLGQEWRKSAE